MRTPWSVMPVLLLAALLAAPQTGCAPAAVGAGAAAGSTAFQDRGVSGALEDTRIRTQINHLWFQEDEVLYRKVSLQVQEGRVLLTGVVPGNAMRAKAVELAWQADGVAEVINEIQVAENYGAENFGRDTWISTQLKTKILFDEEIKSINYSIETVRGVVYLIGVAQTQAELDRVIAHARNLANVRKVVSYVRVKGAESGRTT